MSKIALENVSTFRERLDQESKIESESEFAFTIEFIESVLLDHGRAISGELEKIINTSKLKGQELEKLLKKFVTKLKGAEYKPWDEAQCTGE